MGRDLIAWVFHSPRRLLLVVVAPLLVASLVPVLVSRLTSADEGGRETTSVATTSPALDTETALPGQNLENPTAPPEAFLVVEEFVGVWLAPPADGSDRALREWHARLSWYTTPELSAALRDTDPGRVPEAEVAGPAKLLRAGEYLTEMAVPMSDGRDLNLTITWDGQVWRVSDLEREGGT
jgi:hypothetical protein